MVLAVAAAVLLTGAAGYFGYQYVNASSEPAVAEQEDDQPESEGGADGAKTAAAYDQEPKNADACGAEAKAILENSKHDNIWYCDGQWLTTTQYGTDWHVHFTREGDDWVQFDPDGPGEHTGSCWNKERLDAAAPPPEVRNKFLQECTGAERNEASSGEDTSEPEESSNQKDSKARNHEGSSYVTKANGQSASHPACDGHSVLIVESVVVSNNGNAQGEVEAALQRHPGAELAPPGACPSLRAQLDGQDIYPIYYDYGFNESAVCRDRLSRGGDARILNENPTPSSAC
ncbi:hypothetical protein [Corynebacterium otitidis]|uniref:hypothetical protein n=1 Tax=Corynebacterium otitidis TaxID=29321 RepID=UPI00069A0491|nr:hypothetical protein [Corynebacterium otitidis]